MDEVGYDELDLATVQSSLDCDFLESGSDLIRGIRHGVKEAQSSGRLKRIREQACGVAHLFAAGRGCGGEGFL
jgi:hypothetical protein